MLRGRGGLRFSHSAPLTIPSNPLKRILGRWKKKIFSQKTCCCTMAGRGGGRRTNRCAERSGSGKRVARGSRPDYSAPNKPIFSRSNQGGALVRAPFLFKNFLFLPLLYCKTFLCMLRGRGGLRFSHSAPLTIPCNPLKRISGAVKKVFGKKDFYER